MDVWKWRPIALAAGVVLAAGACRQRDVRTHTFHVTGVTNAACEAAVVAALRGTDTNAVACDRIAFGPGTVTVTYDSMRLARQNIAFAIAEEGFAAEGVPPAPAGGAPPPPPR